MKNIRLHSNKTKILVLIMFCFSFSFYGQQTIFKGLVKKPDGSLFKNTILTIKYKNKQPQLSNVATGTFSIDITDSTNLETISFSYLGYQTTTINAKDALLFIHNNKDADFIVILKVKDIDLNQVVITDKIPFYQKDNFSILDYEIMPNGNLLLVMEKQIFLVTSQDSIIKIVPNTMGIYEIIKACSGRIYLRNKKLLYPTYISNTNLLVSDDPVEINASLSQINQLIACDTAIKIKGDVSSHNQKITYKLQPFSDPNAEFNFYTAENKAKAKQATKEKKQIDRYDSLAFLEQRPTMMTAKTYGTMIGGGSHGKVGAQSYYDEMMSQVWPQDQKVWNYDFYTSKKIFAPVFLQHDSIFVFDHVINKIAVIAYQQKGNTINLNTVLNDSLSYYKKKGWRKIILQDSFSGDFFTIYQNDRLTINSIPLFHDKKQTTIALPKNHFFVEKIKVYNHTAYYLWKDQTNETSMWTLYKVAAR